MCAEDRRCFDELLQAQIREFGCHFEEVAPQQPVLFGDFMVSGAENKVYRLIDDKDRVRCNTCVPLGLSTACITIAQFNYYIFTIFGSVHWNSQDFSANFVP